EGIEGMKRAFIKLMEKETNEWIQFDPGLTREEDDPLYQFRVQLFRERRKRKIFKRVLSVKATLGHRYKSRDAFQYRDTRLVKSSDFPVAFEKVIVGDTVASFDFVNNRANFIRYPEFADGERKHFDIMWRQAGMDAGMKEEEVEEGIEEVEVPLETEFFLD
ncbi:MAG: hypothetical protein QF815_00190, partial [Candidatus Peribacteraceae bacterium]|nr:hypothetical protein [Candidatus Peribacteraceae bacterium]